MDKQKGSQDRSTGVEGIVVRELLSGDYQLVDQVRQLEGRVVPYHGIAQLEMPEERWPEHGQGSRWVWFSKFWGGVFPIEELLVLSRYE